MVASIIGFIDKAMPGYKTYVLMLVGCGMMVCQMWGYHHFSAEAWGMLGLSLIHI